MKKEGLLEDRMLWTICCILLILWLLGMVTSVTMGGAVHILLVIALVIIVLNLVQGRGSGPVVITRDP